MMGLVLGRGLAEWRKVIIRTTHSCFIHGDPSEAKARKRETPPESQ